MIASLLWKALLAGTIAGIIVFLLLVLVAAWETYQDRRTRSSRRR